MRAGTFLLGSAIALAGVWLLTRGAKGACVDLEPDIYYYFTYVGGRKTFQAALGECWDVIWIIEFYDEDTGEWIAPTDPMHDLIESGREYRVKVQEPCTLYGFEPRE